MDEKREFTGVWIPKDIVEDLELTIFEKWIYAEIASFEDFFMKKETLATRYGVSQKTIQRAISHLILKGYIYQVSTNGHKRVLRSCLGWVDKSVQSGGTEMSSPLLDNNIDIYNSPPKAKKVVSTPSFSFEAELKKLWEGKDTDLRVAHYLEHKKISYRSQEQFLPALKRLRTAAKQLDEYTSTELESVFIRLDQESNFGEKYEWTLETVVKKAPLWIK